MDCRHPGRKEVSEDIHAGMTTNLTPSAFSISTTGSATRMIMLIDLGNLADTYLQTPHQSSFSRMTPCEFGLKKDLG
jgi:hypothetical protein